MSVCDVKLWGAQGERYRNETVGKTAVPTIQKLWKMPLFEKNENKIAPAATERK